MGILVFLAVRRGTRMTNGYLAGVCRGDIGVGEDWVTTAGIDALTMAISCSRLRRESALRSD